MFPPDLPENAGRPWKFGKRYEPPREDSNPPGLTKQSLHWTIWAGIATVFVSVVTVSGIGLEKFSTIAANHQKTQDRLAVLEQYRTDNTAAATDLTRLAQQTAIEVAGLRQSVEGLRYEMADLKAFLGKENDRLFTALQSVRSEQSRLQKKESQ